MNNDELQKVRYIEKLLDAGKLEAQVVNGNWWQLRRNGQTKIQPRKGTFYIPIKCGLRTTGRIDSLDLKAQYIRIKE
jgi:hypothetical protein